MEEVCRSYDEEEEDRYKIDQCPALLARNANARHLKTALIAGSLARRKFCLAAGANDRKFAPVRLGHTPCLFQQEQVNDILIYANR
jgi:hypothetical protein